MVQIIEIKNPFEPNRRDVKELYCSGQGLESYIDTEGRDIYIDGQPVTNPEQVIPVDGMQIIVTPHIASHGLKRILGFAAMIALSVYSANIAGGLWAKAGSFFAKGAIGSVLASGAVMFLGGKVINAIFPQQSASLSWNDRQSSQTYGWDLPTPTTVAGNIVGETYGECIPAPQLLEQHVETVNDKQYLNLLYCGGYGPVDEIKDIRIDYTDISNFSEVQIETRLGTNDQKPISFFKNTPLDQSVGIELLKDSVISRTSDSTKATALDVTLEWPAGLYHMNDNGSYGNATVKFKLEYRLRGKTDWNNFNSNSDDYVYEVTGATNEALRRTFSVTGLTTGQYEVRVSMVDKPSTSRYQSMTQWAILTSYIDGIYCRPGKVLVALRIKASNQLSGGVPSLNWRQVRRTVWVHNPETHSYEAKAADNPIWACYDILHGCRRLKNVNTGDEEFVVAGYPAECLDAYYDQWQEAAAYADEEITNQDGEKEPRYRFDAFYDTSQKRWNAAQKAANVGHAAIIPHGRNIGIVVDKPGQITQVFGEGRTTVSSVKGSFSATADRAKAIEITYNDGQNDFKNTVMTVRSPNYNTDHASDNTAQLTLFGVKRRSQAYREAITALATNERQLQFIELSADIDAIVAEYGDIVGYNHTVSRIGIASGRIRSATETTVELDKAVSMADGKGYEIYITLSDDTVVKRQVVAKAGTVDTITVSVPFDEVPQTFDTYAFGETDKAVKPFRIVNASRDGDMLVSLKLAEYDEAMYSTELDYSRYPVIDYSNTPSVAQIEALTASEESYTADRTSISNVRVAWQLARQGIAPDSYIVRIKSRTSDYDEQVSTRMTTHIFRGVRQGDDYDITVYSILDAMTADRKTTSLHVHGTTYATNNASGLVIMLVGKGFNLSWRGATGKAVAGYNVYSGRNGMTMQQCDKVSTAQTTTSCYVPTQDAGQYVFYVESIDKDSKPFGETLTGIGSIAMPGKVTDASAYTIYRQYQDGATGYDIVVNFSLPATAAVADVTVYYKTNHIDMTKLTGALPEGVPADELGYYADWRYAGKGTSRVTIPAAQLGDTYRIKLVAEDVNGFTTPDEDATYLTIKVEAKQTVPDTPTGFHKDFTLGKGFTFAWNDVTNSDVDYYELRYDKNPGAAYNLLARAQGTSITLESMPSRKATIYLYAHNATKKYSYPASLSYDYPVLGAPSGLTLEKAILAVNISVPDIPAGADGVRLYIEHKPIDIGKNTHYAYSNQAGIYAVTACYYDIFGEGYQTAEYQAVIDPYIDPKYIEEESITLEKVDSTIKTAVSDAQQAIPRIETIDENIETINGNITELKKTDGEIISTVAANKKSSDDADASLASQIKQTAASITSTVQSNKDAQDKKNQSLDANISQLEQTAEGITSTVQSNKKASDDADASLASQIKQTADSITSTVQSNKTELSSRIKQNADSITSVVTNLSDSTKAKNNYSAIAQMSDDIALRVAKDDVINQINVSKESILIDGKRIHVTGDTKFDKNVIVGGMIAAGAITADKLSSSTIFLTQNQGIKGGNVTLNAEGMTVVKDSGGGVRFNSSGMQFFDKNNKIYTTTGRIIVGTIQDGQVLTLNSAWDNTPYIIMSPLEISNKLQNITYSEADMSTQCYPVGVSKNGFTGRCRTVASNANAHISKGVSRDKTVTLKASTEEFTSATIVINNTASCSNDDSKRTISVTTKIYVDGVEKITLTSTHSFWQVYCGGGYSSPSAIHQKSADNDQYTGSLTFAKNSVITATVTAVGDYIADAGAVVSMDLHVNETVVSTGTAMFIAVETPNQGYTLG